MSSKHITDILYEFHASADIALEDLAELIADEKPSVVRCKDCKWLVTIKETGFHLCGLEKFDTRRDLTDYCSRGEKNEKEK